MKKLILLILIMTVLMVAGLYFVTKNSQKSGVSGLKVVDNNVNVFQNNRLYFEYPKFYSLNDIPVRDGRVYNYLNFSGNESKINLMTLMFRESTQALDELTDVIMRRGNPLQYSEDVARIGDYRGLLFKTADRKERVAYFIKKGRLLVLTMVSKEPDSPEIDNGFQSILNSVIWK